MPYLPDKVKVCGHVFMVKAIDCELARDMKCIGDMDREGLRIRIGDFMDPSKQAETLLHEVLHAVTDAAGLMDRPGETDEDVVNPIARILFSVITDNPALMAYLQNPE